jgi:hypothetical protein
MITYTRKQLLYVFLFLVGFYSLANAATAPLPNPGVKAEVQSSGNQYWTNVAVKLTNTTNSSIDFRNSSIELSLPAAVSDVYGSYAPLSWPTISVNSVAEGSVTKVTISLGFGTESWVQTMLPANSSITVQFGVAGAVNNESVASNVKVYTMGPAQPAIGKITVKSPKSPGTNAGSTASATLTGPIPNPIQISLPWSSSKTISSLPLGSYTLHINQVGPFPGGNDQTIQLTNAVPSATVTLTYKAAIKTAILTIKVPVMPAANTPSPSAYLEKNGVVEIIPLTWNATKQVTTIAGQVYKLWVPDVKSADIIYRSNYPETKPVTFTANATTATNVTLQFQGTAIPTVHASLAISGLPQTDSKVNISLVSATKTYQYNALGNGNYPIDVQAGQYTLTASTYSLANKTYNASVNNPYSLAEGSIVTIRYAQAKNNSLMPFKDMTYNMNWSTTPVYSNLQEIADNSGHYSYIMAFITQNQWDSTHCYPAWGGQPSLALKDKFYLQEVNYLQSKNGAVAISFGGENGTYIESKCTQAELEQVYQSAFDIYGAAFIDFDIEGGGLGDKAANTNRFKALKALQAKNSNAQVTLTLPANIYGFPAEAMALIQEGKNLGVNIKEYNMMTMAWYSQKLPGAIADSVIASAQKGFEQLQAIYPEKSAAEIWAMIRVTPKIGVDYDGSILYLDDAQKIGQFVKQNGLAGIAFWSADNDRNQNKTQKCNLGANPDCSGIQQAPYDFIKNFLSGLLN